MTYYYDSTVVTIIVTYLEGELVEGETVGESVHWESVNFRILWFHESATNVLSSYTATPQGAKNFFMTQMKEKEEIRTRL